MTFTMPTLKPQNPCFGSGPTAKRLHWTPEILGNALVGRSHRSAEGQDKIQEMLVRMRQVLQIPDEYQLALVAGSASGAVEMAMWNLLGPRTVDSLAFDVFGHRWQYQLKNQLRINKLRCLNAEDGLLPDLQDVDSSHDVVFLWNGSTSGVCMPDGEWIAPDRQGLTLCDATSAVFTTPLPWQKLDVVAFSWQKGLGSEAAHGMLALSPRAVERLESYSPPWPVPGLYRLRENTHFHHGLFQGLTTNTPSMLCLEDCLDALRWAETIGGHDELIRRSRKNLGLIQQWLESIHWLEFLGRDKKNLSTSTICMRLKPSHEEPVKQWGFLQQMASFLNRKRVAYDCLNHSSATPALRIWGGPTVEAEDIRCLLPWLEYAYHEILRNGNADKSS